MIDFILQFGVGLSGKRTEYRPGSLRQHPWRNPWMDLFCFSGARHSLDEDLLELRAVDAGLVAPKEVAAFKALCLTGEDLSYAYAYADGVGNKLRHRLFKTVTCSGLWLPVALLYRIYFELFRTSLGFADWYYEQRLRFERRHDVGALNLLIQGFLYGACGIAILGSLFATIGVSPVILLERWRRRCC